MPICAAAITVSLVIRSRRSVLPIGAPPPRDSGRFDSPCAIGEGSTSDADRRVGARPVLAKVSVRDVAGLLDCAINRRSTTRAIALFGVFSGQRGGRRNPMAAGAPTSIFVEHRAVERHGSS